jgi:hypothetical protein
LLLVIQFCESLRYQLDKKKEIPCAKVSLRKRRKTRSFCCWLFNSANLCAINWTKKKKYRVLKFHSENAEKRGAFVVGYLILRHSAKSAGQKISVYAKVFRRKRGAFVVGYSILRHSAKSAGQKKEIPCAKVSLRKRSRTWSFCCWSFDSATLCEISGAKKKKCCVLKFPSEKAEKRGAFVVGYSIVLHSAK